MREHKQKPQEEYVGKRWRNAEESSSWKPIAATRSVRRCVVEKSSVEQRSSIYLCPLERGFPMRRKLLAYLTQQQLLPTLSFVVSPDRRKYQITADKNVLPLASMCQRVKESESTFVLSRNGIIVPGAKPHAILRLRRMHPLYTPPLHQTPYVDACNSSLITAENLQEELFIQFYL